MIPWGTLTEREPPQAISVCGSIRTDGISWLITSASPPGGATVEWAGSCWRRQGHSIPREPYSWASQRPPWAIRRQLAQRRLGFYARNGAETLGYDCALFGVRYKTICWADPLPDEAEALRKHQEIYLEQFGRERYDEYIQIPLRPGERPRPLTEWVEDIG